MEPARKLRVVVDGVMTLYPGFATAARHGSKLLVERDAEANRAGATRP